MTDAKKRHKRKNYPKKALNAYNIFFKETREKLLIEHGKTNFQDLVRKISVHWKEITDTEKARFDAMAAINLDRYRKEVKEYEQRIVEENESNKKQKTMNTIQHHVFQSTSVGSNMKAHYEYDGISEPAVRSFPNFNISRDRMGMSPGSLDISDRNLTLALNELQLIMHEQLARRSGSTPVIGASLDLHRFGGDYATINNESEPTKRTPKESFNHVAATSNRDEFCRRLDQNRDALSTSQGIKKGSSQLAIGRNRTIVPDIIESREKSSHKADSIAAPDTENRSTPVFEEEEVQNLIHEARIRFGISGMSMDGVRNLKVTQSLRDQQLLVADHAGDSSRDFITQDKTLEEIRLREEKVSERERVISNWLDRSSWIRATDVSKMRKDVKL